MNGKSNLKALFITIGLLAIYRAGLLIPLPFIDASTVTHVWPRTFLFKLHGYSIFLLGFSPAITGFFLVELASYVIKPLSRYRQKGIEGRKTLNRWAILTSTVVASIQTFSSIQLLLEGSFSGSYLVKKDLLSMVVIGLTLIVGFFVVYLLALLITKYGIGNGFCIIIFSDGLIYAIIQTYRYLKINVSMGYSINYSGVLILAFIVFILIKFSISPKKIKASIGSEDTTLYELPSFPQGIVPVNSVLIVSSLLFLVWPKSQMILHHGSWGHTIASLIIIPIASIIFFNLFSNKKRIRYNTFGFLTFDKNLDLQLKRRLLWSILIMTAFYALMIMPSPLVLNQPLLPWLISFSALLISISIINDLVKQWKFRNQANGEYLFLAELDNVHFSSYLKGLFEKEGVCYCLQAFEYRRLFFFFQPLMKISVLVAKKDYEKARALARLEDIKVV